MKNVIKLSLAAFLMCSATASIAEETHTMHSKQMKSEHGVKDGDPMSNAQAISPSNTTVAPHASEGDTHTMHNKQMKSEKGVKDGDAMKNAQAAPAAHSKPTPVGADTHSMHNKQMKSEKGVKDGESMEN